jgi:hypothetical protein
MKPLIPFVVRLFSGKITALISSAVLYVVLYLLAKLAALSPEIAASIDPNKLANEIYLILVVALNAATNKFHLDNAQGLLVRLKGAEGTLQVPVRRAGVLSMLPVLLAFVLIGCSTAQIVSWWKSPATQAGVRIAESVAFNYGVQLAGQYVGGEKIDFKSAGINTAFIAARSLQLTPNASDTVAIIAAVQQSVDDPLVGKRLAAVVVKSAKEAIGQGADPSGALEGALRGVTAAVCVSVNENTPLPK